MELTVLERLLLLNMLPVEGDLTTIRIVRDLRVELSFDEAEHAALNFRSVGTEQVQWDDDAIADKSFDFGAKATALIVTALEKLDSEHKVQQQHLDLFDKFKIGG